MFKAYVAYKKGMGLVFSNLEGTFTRLFDEEKLAALMEAFDKDLVIIHGEVLPENPIRFVVNWASIDDEELDLPEAISITKYLKLDFNQEILGGTNASISNSSDTSEQEATEVTSQEDL